MEKFQAARKVIIKPCDNGMRFKVKDFHDKNLLYSWFYQSDFGGCCRPEDDKVRYRIFDVRDRHLFSMLATPKDDGCFGESGLPESKVVRVNGGDLGKIRENNSSILIGTTSGDRLYDLTNGVLSSDYKIISKFNPGSEGKITKQFGFTSIEYSLEFPDCAHELPDHKILLLLAAMEITRRNSGLE